MDNGKDELPLYSVKRQQHENPFKPLIYALVLSFGVSLGYMVNSISTGKFSFAGTGYNKFDEVLTYINTHYVDTVNEKSLQEKTIHELLQNLDPHSFYIPKKDLAELNEPLEGTFQGIGIEFYIVKDTILVVNAISGGPAESVGLKAGDRIIKINDTIVAGIQITDAMVKQKLRGPKNTKVSVSVMRSSAKKLLPFEIVRAQIPLYSIDAAYMLNEKTGYIRISTFSATTHQEFKEKLKNLKDKGMTKLVIDLRYNGGGYLLAATSIADELIASDHLLLFTKGKTAKRQDYRSSVKGEFETGEVCVLINQFSASASEILAGAIQDLDRGTIIGRTSFGKGLVQEQFDLKDSSAIRLTIARYYTPSGRSIQRPYNNGPEEYNRSVIERGLNEEFIHGDSLTNPDTAIYQTAKGRRVTGGGGIHPDIFVPADTASENEFITAAFPFLREFAYNYNSLHASVPDNFKSVADFKNKFIVTESLMKEFYNYAKAEGLKNDNGQEKVAEPKLKLYLKAFLAKQIWRNDGYYYIINETDPVVNKALEVLK